MNNKPTHAATEASVIKRHEQKEAQDNVRAFFDTLETREQREAIWELTEIIDRYRKQQDIKENYLPFQPLRDKLNNFSWQKKYGYGLTLALLKDLDRFNILPIRRLAATKTPVHRIRSQSGKIILKREKTRMSYYRLYNMSVIYDKDEVELLITEDFLRLRKQLKRQLRKYKIIILYLENGELYQGKNPEPVYSFRKVKHQDPSILKALRILNDGNVFTPAQLYEPAGFSSAPVAKKEVDGFFQALATILCVDVEEIVDSSSERGYRLLCKITER